MAIEGVTNNVGTLEEGAVEDAGQATETTDGQEAAPASGGDISGSDSTYSGEGSSELAALTEDILAKLDQVAEMLPDVIESLGGESSGSAAAPAETTAEPAVDPSLPRSQFAKVMRFEMLQ